MSGIQINPASFNRWHHAMYNLSNSCQIKKNDFLQLKLINHMSMFGILNI